MILEVADADQPAIYNDNEFAKSKRFETYLPSFGGTPLFALTDKQEVRVRRKALMAGLSDRNLRESVGELLDKIDVFLRHIIESQGNPVNLSPAIKWLTFDIFSQYLWGKSLNMLIEPAKRMYVKVLVVSNHRYYVCMQNPILSRFHLTALMYPKLVAGLALRRFWKSWKGVFSKAKTLPEKQLTSGTRNLMSYMTSVYGDREPSSKEGLIYAEETSLLDAGQSILALRWLFVLMLYEF